LGGGSNVIVNLRKGESIPDGASPMGGGRKRKSSSRRSGSVAKGKRGRRRAQKTAKWKVGGKVRTIKKGNLIPKGAFPHTAKRRKRKKARTTNKTYRKRITYTVRKGKNKGKKRTAWRTVSKKTGRALAPRSASGRFRRLNPGALGILAASGSGLLSFSLTKVIGGQVSKVGALNKPIGPTNLSDLLASALIVAPVWLLKGKGKKPLVPAHHQIGITAGSVLGALVGDMLLKAIGKAVPAVGKAIGKVPGMEAAAAGAIEGEAGTGAYAAMAGYYRDDGQLDAYVHEPLQGYMLDQGGIGGVSQALAGDSDDALSEAMDEGLDPAELAREGVNSNGTVVRATAASASNLASTGAARVLGNSRVVPGALLVEIMAYPGDPRGILPLQNSGIPYRAGQQRIERAAGQDIAPGGIFGNHAFSGTHLPSL